MKRARSGFALDRRSVLSIGLAAGFGILGVVLAHHPMIFSGFRRIQADLGDSRLIHYLLEHGYLWAQRDPEHLDFWNAPFFYPVKNVAAYSDVLLSVGPVYWLWRALGESPDVAFGLWIISMSALNYAAGLLLFRNGFGFGVPAAVAGASLVAFGAPRMNQLKHQQLLPFFFPLLALYALARLVGDLSLGRRARAGYWLLAMVALVAQLYAGVYLGWFTVLGLGLAAVVALAMRPCREVLLKVFWRDAWAITAAVVVATMLFLPFLNHYLPAAREVQLQYYPLLRALHPNKWSWLEVGPSNWFWGWLAHPAWPYKLEFLNGEHLLGIGWLTSIACVAGLYLGRKWSICRLAAATAFIVWLSTTYLPGIKLAVLATVVVSYCMAGLYHEIDRPGLRLAALAAALCPVLLVRFPDPCVIVLGLTTIGFCVLEMGRVRERPLDLIVPGIAYLAISLTLFGLEMMLYGVILVAPVAAVLAYYWWPLRLEVGIGSLGALTLLLIVITFLHLPGVVLGGLAVAPVSLALSAPDQYRPPAWLLLRAMLIALPVLALFYGRDSLWLSYNETIPGGIAIRAIGRVVLILLVPAALGLACLVQYLDQSRVAMTSWIVALVCLAEQTVTIDTYDVAENRASIENLASQVDQGQVAFYYHSREDFTFPRHHLDAMWASLETRVPTVNGYSGHAPRSWRRFFRIDTDPEESVEDALADWEQSQGLLPNHVQWIGADPRRASQSEAMQAPFW